MAELQEELETEPLQVADTRPVLLAGVPYELALSIIFGTTALSNQMHSIIWPVAVGIPVWLISAFLVRRDYNYARIFQIWFRTSAMSRDSHIFGGASISPFPHNTKRFRGMLN